MATPPGLNMGPPPSRPRGRPAANPPAAPTQSLDRPLVRRLNLQQLLDREAEKPPEPQDLGEETWTALVSQVRKAWEENKLAKQRIDVKLLDCLRARRGVYSATQMAVMQQQGGMNIVWADLTETKCKAGSSWVRDVLTPVGERPWGIDVTPLVDLPMPMKKAVVAKALKKAQEIMVQSEQAAMQVAAGSGEANPGTPQAMIEPPEPMSPEEFRDLVHEVGEKLREEAEATYRKIAQARAKRMETQIADRLVQGGFYAALDGFIEDFVTYPAAIIKGPIYARHKKLSWGEGWQPQVSNAPAQTWSHVSPFDVYPAPSTKDPQKGDFIERIRFRRDELHDLKGLPGYQDEQIDLALRDYSEGHLEGWLWTEAERQRLTQETSYMWLSPAGVIDALNFWGSIPGWKLMSYGVEGLEETKDYECNVLLCGRYVLYAALNTNPLGARPYRKACYDEIPGAFWGRSVPDLAATSQKMCNGIACALADNLSIASGPQVWTHVDRLADGEQSMELFPWKNWQLKSDPTQGVNPGIGFFQPDDRAASLMATYEKWELRADDATGIPRYTYGNQHIGGAGNTLGGLTTLMQNAAKGLRRAIANIDENVIGPTIYDAFVNEMLYNPDESIKGDNVVVPRGAAAILIREAAQQKRIQFLGMTANPIDAQIIGVKGRAEVLRATAQALELPEDVVPSDEDLEAQMKAAADAEAEKMAALQKGETDKILLEHKLDMEKEAAIAKREDQTKSADLLADVVKQAVANAMKTQTEQRKKVKFNYDDKGVLVGGETE